MASPGNGLEREEPVLVFVFLFFPFDYDFFYNALNKCFENYVTSFVDDEFEVLQLGNIFFL